MDNPSAKAGPHGPRFAALRWLGSTGSTNTDALEAVTATGADVVVVADHQSAGRGRRGRHWEAPPGSSLLMSLATADPVVTGHARLAVTVVGLAAMDACERVAGVRALLKWPNDLVVDDRKLAGILAELHPHGDREVLVVGIGVNCNWVDFPPELAGTATALNLESGAEVDREELVRAVLDGVEERLDALSAEGGTAALHDEAVRRSATIGRDVVVDRDGSSLAGRAVGLAPDGALVVRDGAGTRHVVHAGDVVHLRPA